MQMNPLPLLFSGSQSNLPSRWYRLLPYPYLCVQNPHSVILIVKKISVKIIDSLVVGLLYATFFLREISNNIHNLLVQLSYDGIQSLCSRT
jgi:hypothetical protein